MTVQAKASQILVLTCALWGASFTLMKALEACGRVALPDASSLFLASACIAWRFSLATLVMGAVCGRSLTRLTRREWQQGAGIGLFGGGGLVLQMDGLAYTQASTSAFLTQAYCILIPIWVALHSRRWPSAQVWGACALALLGAGILGGGSTGRFALGRGEWETLAGSVLFAGQILWLERPRYAGNRVMPVTTVMFFLMTLSTTLFALWLAPKPSALWTAYAAPAPLTLLVILTVVCTLLTFPIANRWQPKVNATQAGLLYSTEPIFASTYALFLPAWLGRFAGVDYPNESLTWNLVAGGALILVANGWLLRYPPRTPQDRP